MSGHYTIARKLNLNFETIVTEPISDEQENASEVSENRQYLREITRRNEVIDSGASSVNIPHDIDNESTQSSATDYNNLDLHSRYVISRRNKLKKSFDLVMDLLIYYSVITALNLLGFFDDSQALNDVDYFVGAVFVVDFFLNFCTEYKNKQKQVVKNFRLIALHYAKTWMVFDILALLPFTWIGRATVEYFLRLLRIFKMKRFLNKIDVNLISNYFATWVYNSECIAKKRLRLKIQYAWNLMRELLKMIFCAYFFSSLWLYYIRTIVAKVYPTDNFLVDFNIQGLTIRNQFFRTWYFIFSTLMTVGYGDFHATNTYEMGFCVILVIVGPTWFAFSMGRAIRIINCMKKLSGTENKMQDLNMWISHIERKNKVIPPNLREKIHEHFLHFWRNDRLGSIYIDHEQHMYETADIFFQDLPLRIKNRLIEYLFDDIFYKFTYFFRHFKDVQNEIALLFQPRFYNQDSIILESDTHPTELFFKTKGHIAVEYPSKGSFLKISTISDIFIVGDLFAFQGTHSTFQFKARSKVQGFSIPVPALKSIIEAYQVKLEDYIKFIDAIYSSFRQKIIDEASQKFLGTEEELRLIERYSNKKLIDSCVLKAVKRRTVKRAAKKNRNSQYRVRTIKVMRGELFVSLKEQLGKLLLRVSV